MTVTERPTPSPGAQTPFVSVVIPVFDHAHQLPRCLTALAEQTYPRDRYEIVLVDNGAGLDSLDYEHFFEGVEVVEETSAGSYAARNRGVAQARGAVLAFTDADCVPRREWLEHGVRALMNTPHVGFVAGAIQLRFEDADHPTAAELYEGFAAFRQKEYVERWSFGATANLFTFRDVFDAVGPFDTRLFALGDRDWGRRVSKAGLQLLYAADACVEHPARRTLGELRRRTQRVTGGFFQMLRSRSLPLASLLYDAPMGLVPLRRLLRPRVDNVPFASGFRRRLLVALVVSYVVAIRVVELARLACGGNRRR